MLEWQVGKAERDQILPPLIDFEQSGKSMNIWKNMVATK